MCRFKNLNLNVWHTWKSQARPWLPVPSTGGGVDWGMLGAYWLASLTQTENLGFHGRLYLSGIRQRTLTSSSDPHMHTHRHTCMYITHKHMLYKESPALTQNIFIKNLERAEKSKDARAWAKRREHLPHSQILHLQMKSTTE